VVSAAAHATRPKLAKPSTIRQPLVFEVRREDMAGATTSTRSFSLPGLTAFAPVDHPIVTSNKPATSLTPLEKIRSTVLRLNTINKIINRLPVCQQRSELADEDARITLWLTDQLPNGLVAQFTPFLTLQQKRIALRPRWRRLSKPAEVE